MLTVNLPELVAGRDLADEIVDKLGPLTDEVVVLDCGRLVNGTASFAAQVVQRVLGDNPSARLVVRAAPDRFAGYLAHAAEQLHAAERLDIDADTGAPATSGRH